VRKSQKVKKQVPSKFIIQDTASLELVIGKEVEFPLCLMRMISINSKFHYRMLCCQLKMQGLRIPYKSFMMVAILVNGVIPLEIFGSVIQILKSLLQWKKTFGLLNVFPSCLLQDLNKKPFGVIIVDTYSKNLNQAIQKIKDKN
jgi:hypothetical protein